MSSVMKAKAEKEAAFKELKDIELRNAQMDIQQKQVTESTKAEDARLDALERGEEMARLKAQAQLADEEVSALQTELGRELKDFDAQIQLTHQLTKESAELRLANLKAGELTGKLSDEVVSVEAESERLLEQNKDLTSKVEALEAQLAELPAEVSSRLSQLAEIEGGRTSAEQTRDGLSSQCEALEDQIQTDSAQLAKWADKNRESKSLKEVRDRTLSNLDAEIRKTGLALDAEGERREHLEDLLKVSLEGLETKTRRLEDWWHSTSIGMMSNSEEAARMAQQTTAMSNEELEQRSNDEIRLVQDQDRLERGLRMHIKEVDMEMKKRQDTLNRLGSLQAHGY